MSALKMVYVNSIVTSIKTKVLCPAEAWRRYIDNYLHSVNVSNPWNMANDKAIPLTIDTIRANLQILFIKISAGMAGYSM